MLHSIKKIIKRATVAVARSQQEAAYHKLVDYVRHDYPSNWTSQQIVNELRQKHGVYK